MHPDTPFPPIESTDLASVPIERSETIPSRWYTDTSFHAFDNAAVFAGTWQYVGPASAVARRGQVATASIAGNPILVARGDDGKLRGFYNVCRHRGGPLAVEADTCKVLQCKYHGWTYTLDGALRGVPQFDRVELFDKKDYGLLPIRTEIWEGLVFATLAPTPEPLTRRFAGILERVAPLRIGGLAFDQRFVYDVACNWKVYMDNYLEGYHLPYVHPELCNLLDYHRYVTETAGDYILQYSPLKEEENIYRAEDGEAYYYAFFPNFMLNILPGRLQVNHVEAVAADRCRVIFDYFYADLDAARAKGIVAADHEYSDRVQHEDIEICEQVQKGLESNAYDRGRFSVKCEQGVYHFQQLLKQAYRAELKAGNGGS